MKIGEFVQALIPDLPGAEVLEERVWSENPGGERIGQPPVEGDVLGIGEDERRDTAETSRRRDENASDGEQNIGVEIPRLSDETQQSQRIFGVKAPPASRGLGKNEVVETEALQETDRDVLVAGRDEDLVAARPQPCDGRAEEVHMGRMSDFDEEPHFAAEHSSAYFSSLFLSMSIQSANRMLWMPELRHTPAKMAATELIGPTLIRR